MNKAAIFIHLPRVYNWGRAWIRAWKCCCVLYFCVFEFGYTGKTCILPGKRNLRAFCSFCILQKIIILSCSIIELDLVCFKFSQFSFILSQFQLFCFFPPTFSIREVAICSFYPFISAYLVVSFYQFFTVIPFLGSIFSFILLTRVYQLTLHFSFLS